MWTYVTRGRGDEEKTVACGNKIKRSLGRRKE